MSNADATWGQGSAAALDLLRRRNFRGRRDEVDAQAPSYPEFTDRGDAGPDSGA